MPMTTTKKKKDSPPFTHTPQVQPLDELHGTQFGIYDHDQHNSALNQRLRTSPNSYLYANKTSPVRHLFK